MVTSTANAEARSTTAWLPYESVAAARAAVGDVAGVSYGAFRTPDMPLPADPDLVELIVLPNQGGGPAWDALRQRPMPRLRAIQLGSAGYEHMLAVLPPGVQLCNAAGVHDAGTAELAIALALANLRRLDIYARQQADHHWQGAFSQSLADRRALIFGYGRIGAAVESRLRPFEPASIVRVARSARTDPPVQPVTELRSLLPAVDLVFITAPATPETTGAFDAEMLAALPDGALVVNVGRGVVIDTDAMLAEAGRLRFALDVTDPEPLPADHPLWDAPHVTIAPHVGGYCASYDPRMARLIRRQLDHLAAGEPFENVVAEGAQP